MHMFGNYGMGIGGGNMIIMGFVWTLVFFATIYFLGFLTNKSASNVVKMDSAEDILKGRYAQGEISEEQFVKIKKGLRD